jgi:hypothetical protein
MYLYERRCLLAGNLNLILFGERLCLNLKNLIRIPQSNTFHDSHRHQGPM